MQCAWPLGKLESTDVKVQVETRRAGHSLGGVSASQREREREREREAGQACLGAMDEPACRVAGDA